MKKKLISMFAIFAIAFSCMFGFVGCGNKQEEAPAEETPAGLTEAEVVGTYNATQVVISGGYEGFVGTHTFEDYAELPDGALKNFLVDFFGANGIYKFKNDGGTKVVTLDDVNASTWTIENNTIKVTPNVQPEDGTNTYSITRAANGNLTVNITYTDAENADYSFTAVLTLVKQA